MFVINNAVCFWKPFSFVFLKKNYLLVLLVINIASSSYKKTLKFLIKNCNVFCIDKFVIYNLNLKFYVKHGIGKV